jgi:hypothetical protein
MADPIVKKISELQEMIDALAADDLIAYVDVSELLAANRTKHLKIGNLKLLSASQLTDGIVTEPKIADGAVTETKIGSGAVTGGKIATGAVTNAKLGSSAVTDAKIANNTITANKLANDTNRIVAVTAKSGDQTISAGTTVLLTGWSNQVAIGVTWDGANNRYIIQRSGTYLVYLNGIISTPHDVSGLVMLTRGGTTIWVGDQNITGRTTPTRFSCSAIYVTEAGDILRPWIQNNEGATGITVKASLTYSGAILYTQFSLCRIN